MGEGVQGHVAVCGNKLALFHGDVGVDDVEDDRGHGKGNTLCRSKLPGGEAIEVTS